MGIVLKLGKIIDRGVQSDDEIERKKLGREVNFDKHPVGKLASSAICSKNDVIL